MSGTFWSIFIAVGAVGMAVCLYGMYGNQNHGFPALHKLDARFSSLDMRKGYSPTEVFACFDGVGAEGQRLLISLWKLDFVFILFFWMVMVAVSHNVVRLTWLRWGLMGVATVRAILDGFENLVLGKVCRAYPEARLEQSAKAASIFTQFKWGMMALWVLGLFASLLVQALAMGA
ncbi:MAG: hypothetical protein PHI98_10070 [Eubacteriales bacterium]|nr:hypothetical protein [Eubacteriales bacterium]